MPDEFGISIVDLFRVKNLGVTGAFARVMGRDGTEKLKDMKALREGGQRDLRSLETG